MAVYKFAEKCFKIVVNNSFYVYFVFCVLCHAFSTCVQVPTLSGLCIRDNTSCSHQFDVSNALEEDLCFMRYFPSTDCNDLVTEGDFLGHATEMRLSTYLYVEGYTRITAFNISFQEMKWNRLKMWFKPISNESNASMCREFSLSKKVELNNTLFFDCLWSMERYEGTSYQFRYAAFLDEASDFPFAAKYVFQVPLAERIDIERTNATEWEVFMYLDISALPLVTLHVQEAPSHLKIKSYIIDVHRNWGSSSWTASSFTIPATDVKNGEIVLQYNARYKPGIYHFTVSLNHGRCGEHLKKCFVSTSPKFFVVSSNPNPPLLIAIVGVVVLIPILVTIFLLWRKQIHPEVLEKAPPRMLIVYNGNYAGHVRVIKEFARYLNDVCGIDALLDYYCVPESSSKDPAKWYAETFNTVDYVAVFASPPQSYAQCVQKYVSLYPDMEAVALNLLRRRLAQIPCLTRFLSVVLPYCLPSTLGAEAKDFTRFMLFSDLDKMLTYIRENRIPIFPLKVEGGVNDLETKGAQLLETVKSVQKELENCEILKRNGSKFERRKSDGSKATKNDFSEIVHEMDRSKCTSSIDSSPEDNDFTICKDDDSTLRSRKLTLCSELDFSPTLENLDLLQNGTSPVKDDADNDIHHSRSNSDLNIEHLNLLG
ncbi:unnamed protein product [Bemisia tabaci]|uniref:SEFIR domain-containing protein n=1 Tax=Bemisia tabaci TaxID=7038 RepID=A0A9P0A4T0_BEMTA|nr:unnamed protein product [Bemisia tabaci]